jgi:GAF domain-containing protein
MAADAARVLLELQKRAVETSDPDALGRTVVAALKEEIPQASWVGIYWLRGDALVLGPFVGPPTEHVRIPVGRGVCGTAVAEGRDVVVPDVREVGNYLACSATVRSEIVVLIRSHGVVVGQLDLDAEAVRAFGEVDHRVLRAVADGFGGLLPYPLAAPPSGAPPGGDDAATA